MKSALIVEKLTKSFDVNIGMIKTLISPKEPFVAVENVSFNVEENTVFGILGSNGSGKSTLIRMISTLIIPDSGSIQVFGIDVVKRPAAVKRLIGRVSVDASFFMKLSALENLDYARGIYGLGPRSLDYAIEILKELKFPKSKLKIPLEKLSRGQQQKIAIARGFIAKPKLVLLDEPTTGLDPLSKLQVLGFLKEKVKECTIVLTSHDMDEADSLCKDMIILSHGKVAARGTSFELKEKHGRKGVYMLDTDSLDRTKIILEKMDFVLNLNVEYDKKGKPKLTMYIENIESSIGIIVKELERNKIKLLVLARVMPSLEDVFVKVAGDKE